MYALHGNAVLLIIQPLRGLGGWDQLELRPGREHGEERRAAQLEHTALHSVHAPQVIEAGPRGLGQLQLRLAL